MRITNGGKIDEKVWEKGPGFFAAFEPSWPILALEAQAKTFKDVPQDHWAYGVISEVSDAGLINGYPDGTFGPDAHVTTAEFINMLYNVYGGGYEGGKITVYQDVLLKDWYFEPVTWAFASNMLFDVPLLQANEPINRQGMAHLLYQYMLVYHPGSIGKEKKYFQDLHLAMHDQRREQIQLLGGSGIFAGRDAQHFAPLENMTRAEAAALISRVKEKEKTYPLRRSIPVGNYQWNPLNDGYRATPPEDAAREINRYRAMHGLAPLTVHPSLNAASTIRAYEGAHLPGLRSINDMQAYTAQGGDPHLRPDGRMFHTVMEEVTFPKSWYGFGEILYFSNYNIDAQALARDWYNSPSHRKVMLNPRHTYVGFGEARNASGKLNGYAMVFSH